MKKKNLICSMLVAATLFAVACAESGKKVARELLTSNEWDLREIVTKDSTVTQMPESGAWISFSDSTSRVVGNAGCNAFFGTFETPGGNEIKFGLFGRTMMFCPDMEIEDLYMSTLEKMTFFLVENEILELSNDAGAKLLFDRRSAAQ